MVRVAAVTVRAVAARANVAPATAYTYFSSKNHLVAEVYLDLVRQVPFFTDVNDSRLSRVQQTLRSLALVVAAPFGPVPLSDYSVCLSSGIGRANKEAVVVAEKGARFYGHQITTSGRRG